MGAGIFFAVLALWLVMLDIELDRLAVSSSMVSRIDSSDDASLSGSADFPFLRRGWLEPGVAGKESPLRSLMMARIRYEPHTALHEARRN